MTTACGPTLKAALRNDATGRALRKMMRLVEDMTFTTCESTGGYLKQVVVLGTVARACGLGERGPEEPPVPCRVCDGRGLVHKGMECPECGGWGIVFKELGRGGHRGKS